jgi:uncharacterized membrane protein YidH (DUF202 family)
MAIISFGDNTKGVGSYINERIRREKNLLIIIITTLMIYSGIIRHYTCKKGNSDGKKYTVNQINALTHRGILVS